MGLIAKNTGGDFELMPEGMAVARCFKVIDIGTQYSEAFNVSAHKILISWEFPEEKMKDERPFAITKQYTLSLHKKASLRHDLESWRGKKFTDEEAAGFDISKLIGATCFINVVHNKQGDSTYANIAAITPLSKGLSCPPAVNPTTIFDIDNFNQDVFDTFSEKLKEKIMASPEYKLIFTITDIPTEGMEEGSSSADDDSTPF